MRRFLRAIRSTIFGFLGLFCDLFQHFCDAAARSPGIAPTVPPADDVELEEIAEENLALDAVADLPGTLTKTNIYLFEPRHSHMVRAPRDVAALVNRGHAAVTSLYYGPPHSVAYVETTRETAS